jgi:glycosyltransferase involved in cell wall biosynthesis
MLVARVLAKLEPGGAQLSALRVVRGLEAHGIRSRVLVGWATPDGLALAERMGVDVEVYGAGGDQQWQADRRFARWLRPRLRGVPIVHAHMFGGWWAASRAVAAGAVLVASEHNALTWPAGEPPNALRDGLRRVDRMYAHGPGAREAMLAAGLDPARLRPGVSPIADLEAVPSPGLPARRIVFSGRLHPEKGPDVLLEALALLPHAPPALLLGEGPLRPTLERRLRALGLSHRVKLRGWQARPGGTIAGASVLVVPSRDESWSQTAVLGMALRVPVIGTDVDGLPDTLADARGIVVAAGDAEALAQAIGDVLSGRRVTDLSGAHRYAQQFSTERVSAEYAAAYRELASGPVADDAAAARSVVQA